MLLLRVDSLAGTRDIAIAVAGLARPGDVIVLAGDMGAGKTAFAQGFGLALGVQEAMTSPTFTLVHSHPCPGGRLTLHHADLYRLDTIEDVHELALHELAEFGGIVLVEWGDIAAAVLGDHLEVRLSVDAHDEAMDGAGVGETGVGEPGNDIGDDPADEFGLDEHRSIELHATGGSWAGRWERLTEAVAVYRC